MAVVLKLLAEGVR